MYVAKIEFLRCYQSVFDSVFPQTKPLIDKIVWPCVGCECVCCVWWVHVVQRSFHAQANTYHPHTTSNTNAFQILLFRIALWCTKKFLILLQHSLTVVYCFNYNSEQNGILFNSITDSSKPKYGEKKQHEQNETNLNLKKLHAATKQENHLPKVIAQNHHLTSF